MLARLQQFTTLFLICAAAIWAAHFATQGKVGWAGAGAVIILLGYALFLAAEFVLLALVRQSDPAPQPTVAQLLRAWWAEVLTAPQVFCWRQPFRSRAEPDFLPASARGNRGVVFVHGFVCNRALWNPWMARLRPTGVAFVSVNLEPLFGSIDNYVGIIDDAVAQLEAATGLPPVLVAHSMGGLAARAWLATRSADARIHRVITIGTPHHGTWLARFGHTLNGQQMRIGSNWLARLAEHEPPGQFAKFSCCYSHCDNIVFPARTATLNGASNIHVPGAAHVHLAFQPEVFNEVTRWLQPANTEAARLAPS